MSATITNIPNGIPSIIGFAAFAYR